MKRAVIRNIFALVAGVGLGIGELAADWSEPQTLNCYQDNSFGQLVMDGSGNSLAIWQCAGDIQIGSLPANGSWTVSTLASPQGDEILGRPNVAVDRQGNAMAVWNVYGANNSSASLMYSQKPAGGNWSVPSTPDKIASNWVNLGGLTFDAEGNATIGWFGLTGIGHSLCSSTLLKGSSTWGTTQLISSFASLSVFDLQSDAQSNLAVISQKGDGTILLSVQSAGTSQWSNPPIIMSEAAANVSPALAFFQGVAAVVWIDSEKHSVWANSYSLQDGIQTPTQLNTDKNENSNPAIAFDSSGNAVAVWGNNKGGLYCSRMLWGQSSWSAPQLITPKFASGSTPSIKSDISGNLFVLWLSTHDASYQLERLALNAETWTSLGTIASTTHLKLEDSAFAVSATEAGVVVFTLEGEIVALENPSLY